jgi:hypothetical protein
MVPTRAEGKEALSTHILKNVFQLEQGSPLSLALSKVIAFSMFTATLDVTILKDYNMKTPKGTGRISKGFMHIPFESSSPQVLLACIIMWRSALLLGGVAVKAFDFKEYDRFRMSSTYGEMNKLYLLLGYTYCQGIR